MEIVGRLQRSVHAAGNFRPEDVANYVRDRVVVDRVELGAARTIFPNAKIKNAAPSKIFRIEVVASSPTRTVIDVTDITPPPSIQGIDEAERWRRAGFKPDGTPLDPTKLE